MKNNCDKKVVKKTIKKARKTKREAVPNKNETAPLEKMNETGLVKEKRFEKMEVEEMPYKEIYFDRYAEKEGGDQKYATKRNRDQYYKTNEENTEEVFAKKFKNNKMEEFYAQTAEEVEFLPKKKVGDTWVTGNYRQDVDLNYIYPFNNVLNKEEYEYEENGDPKLAFDKYGKPYYPSEKDSVTDDFIQYIPTRRDGIKFYIIDNGNQVYPKNVTKNIFVYPKDDEGNEYYLKDANNEDYYIKNGDSEIYASVKFGDYFKNILAVRNNALTYAKINNGRREIYPIDTEFQKEYFITDDDQNPKWATDENGKPYYPSYKNPLSEEEEIIQYIPITENAPNVITENGKQIYPKNVTKNVFVYPKDKNGDEYYLTNENNEEYYIENENDKQIYASYKSGVNKLIERNGEPIYAKEGKKEIYPVYGLGKSQFYKMIDSVERGALLNIDEGGYYYAKTENKDEYYPKDFSLPEDGKLDNSATESDTEDEKTNSDSETEDEEEKNLEEEEKQDSADENKENEAENQPPNIINRNRLNDIGID